QDVRRRIGWIAAAALAAGCGEPEKAAPPAPPKAVEAKMADSDRLERQVEGQRFGMTLNRVSAPTSDLIMRLKAATTINVDAPAVPSNLGQGGKLELKPAAADALERLPKPSEPGE